MVHKDMQVRENLTMDSTGTTTFTTRRGYMLSLTTLCLLGAFFICTLIAVSFIVYNFATCPGLSEPVKHICDHQCFKVNGKIPSDSFDDNYESSENNILQTKSIDKNVRLPKSVIPLQYNISLIPFLFDGNFTFNGDVKITILILEDCKNITLHTADIKISKEDVTVRLLTSRTKNEPTSSSSSSSEEHNNEDEFLKIKSQYFVITKQFFVMEFDEILRKNTEYEIHIKYVGKMLDYLQGFYRSSYQVGNEKRWLASTQFQPTDARRAFPCFDEPALKANFTINIARPRNLSSLSNMPKINNHIEKIVDDFPQYVWDNYEESLPMSTYLVAFTISDFANKSSNDGFSVWARSDAINSADYALSIGPRILKNLENYFNINFPLPKIDMIAIPDFHAGAMENWGLITYRETAMLYEEGVSARTNKQRIASVVGHELAHQWFGNLVTPSWWSDIWLNEGFASYMEYLAVDDVEPEWKTMDQFVVNELQNVFQLDAMSSSHKISIEVDDPDEINEIFDRISYGKGATIIRMMSHFLTSKVFRSGLTKYLNEMAYKSAEQDDLWKFLTNEAIENGILDSSIEVKTIMDTWTLQTGFPVLNIKKSPTSRNIFRLEQERFVYVHKNRKESENLLWWIPLTYTTNKHLDFQSTRPSNWIPRTKIYEIDNRTLGEADWYIFNIQQTGYYRINYDEENWKSITKHLINSKRFKDIAPSNRAQLIDDSMNLARGGYLNYEIALNITRYLKHEDEHVPWKAAITSFNFIDSMFINDGDYHLIKNYLLKQMNYVYKKVSFDDTKDQKDNMLTLFRRIEILNTACHLGHPDCVSKCVRVFQNWMADPNPDINNPISPNLRNIVYCTAIEYGSESEWDFAFERYNKSKVSSEKEILLSSLGCTKEPWILSRYLQKAITGDSIRKQDVYRVFAAVSNNVVGQQIAFDFIRNRWTEMKTYMGSVMSNLNGIVKFGTRKMNSNFLLKELQEFIKLNYKETSRTIQQALEQVQINIDWKNRNYKIIVEWLKKEIKENSKISN